VVKRREDLTSPRANRRIGVQYDSDAFGAFSESIARFLGTARFLVFQTILIVLWIAWNLFAPDKYQFDPWDRGLVLLTLVLSLQASYAAPLILLAQNRQEGRDRVQSELDRHVAERTQSDTEFLAREIAGVRLMLADVVTGEELKDQLADLRDALARLAGEPDGGRTRPGDQAASEPDGVTPVGDRR
jgi:uncharacterized membrane protein